jgi:hypothetical protein
VIIVLALLTILSYIFAENNLMGHILLFFTIYGIIVPDHDNTNPTPDQSPPPPPRDI